MHHIQISSIGRTNSQRGTQILWEESLSGLEHIAHHCLFLFTKEMQKATIGAPTKREQGHQSLPLAAINRLTGGRIHLQIKVKQRWRNSLRCEPERQLLDETRRQGNTV